MFCFADASHLSGHLPAPIVRQRGPATSPAGHDERRRGRQRRRLRRQRDPPRRQGTPSTPRARGVLSSVRHQTSHSRVSTQPKPHMYSLHIDYSQECIT